MPRIADLPDLGAVTDASTVLGEKSGAGQFEATALRDYITAAAALQIADLTAQVATLTARIATIEARYIRRS